jgi:hypothetical protein
MQCALQPEAFRRVRGKAVVVDEIVQLCQREMIGRDEVEVVVMVKRRSRVDVVRDESGSCRK